MTGLLRAPGARQAAESALAVVVGLTFSVVLLLYFFRPATIPRGASLLADLRAAGRWMWRKVRHPGDAGG